MDWIQVIVILCANFGVIIPLFLHSDSKMEAHRKETGEILKAIQQEMKDFHGRLERQDAEFRTRLLAIEERSRSKIL